MDAAVIKFKASGQQLSVVSTNLFAANTVNYIRAEFELGDGWDGFDVVRAVWATDFAKIATILDTDGVTMVPWEVLKRTATLYVNLVGSISDGDELTDRLTTYKAKALHVNGCTNVDGDNTQPITPSQFEQFVAVVHDDAEAAADARDEARGYASDAEAYRDEAVGAAADAKDYRDAAKGYADDAEDYKDQAKGYADDAEADAEEIRNMTATATTLPEGSSATASYADGVLSLGIPRGDTGATGATGNGIASAVLNADYTLTLNFTDGTHYTTPPIRGAQGVQGETGNGIDRIELTDTTGAVKTYTIYFTDGSTYDFEVTDGEVTLAELASVLPTDTASGPIASFPDGSDLFDYLSCIVNIEPVQAGSGTPSPDNVRPITGWTGCEVDVCGVNLFDLSQFATDYPTYCTMQDGVLEVIATGTLYTTGCAVDIPLDASGGGYITYDIKNNTSSNARVRVYYEDGTYTLISAISSSDWTTHQGALQNKRVVSVRFDWSTSGTFSIKNFSINYPSTDHDYHAYNGQTYNITWQTEAGTVYGGSVDLVSGVLTVDRASIDMGALNWGYNATRAGFFVSIPNSTWFSGMEIIASAYEYVGAKSDSWVNTAPSGQMASGSYQGIQLKVKNTEYTDAPTFKTAMTGQTIVYDLATPTTYQLDPVQVACLLGHNNVWADCGEIEEVKYKADVQKWVEKQLREINTAILALS